MQRCRSYYRPWFTPMLASLYIVLQTLIYTHVILRRRSKYRPWFNLYHATLYIVQTLFYTHVMPCHKPLMHRAVDHATNPGFYIPRCRSCYRPRVCYTTLWIMLQNKETHVIPRRRSSFKPWLTMSHYAVGHKL